MQVDADGNYMKDEQVYSPDPKSTSWVDEEGLRREVWDAVNELSEGELLVLGGVTRVELTDMIVRVALAHADGA